MFDFLFAVLAENPAAEAIIWKDDSYRYGWLVERISYWRERLHREHLRPGTVVALESDFSPNAVAIFLALIERGCILVPLTTLVEIKKTEFRETAQVEVTLRLDEQDNLSVARHARQADHELYRTLRGLGHPGLVLFSSGSTGKSKAAVHDFCPLVQKFRTRRHNLRTLTFLLFDHIGGIDTMLYSLSNGSCIVTVQDRSPNSVCRAIAKHRVEVLPVTPTFLNLLLLSEAYAQYDLSSLKYITYGTEVMPEHTLKRCAEIFPGVTLLQKYGTTEVGTLRSKSKRSDSVWVKVGGEGYRTRVVDGILHIKADSAMLGYLNAPSPFTSDGWFVTDDEVVQDGEYIRFLGRKAEIINVGGEKVHPVEVEAVIESMDNIAEVTVYGERNPIVGHIVCARVTPRQAEDPKQLAARIKAYCRARMENYRVPVKIEILTHAQHTARFKKVRRSE